MNTDASDPLDTIRRRIAAAVNAAGRDPGSVSLTAVSKQQPWPAVAAVLDAGQRVFGENRVQEAMERWRERRPEVELRLIGPLQTNKAAEAVAFFDVIETVDRDRIAERLSAEMARQGRTPRLLVQVNTGEEANKAGVAPREAEAFLDLMPDPAFGLTIAGLMCIPPIDEPPGPHFALLAKIARRNGLRGTVDGHERRLRDRDPPRRHRGARRLRPVRRTPPTRLGP